MNLKSLTVLVIFITNFRPCQSVSYHDYSLYSCTPVEMEHLRFLQDLALRRNLTGDIKFWTPPVKLYDPIQFMITKIDMKYLNDMAKRIRLETRLMIPNVQEAFDKQAKKGIVRMKPGNFSWDIYNSFEEVNEWMKDMALKYPNVVVLETIGKSAENRDIISFGIKKTPGNMNKAIVESGLHPHEWISTSFVTYLIDQLLVPRDRTMVELGYKYHWYFIPIVNPDGYIHNQRMDRMWMKNRRALDNSVGVNLNRNFNCSFCEYDSSKDPNSDRYCGPEPFSEPETKALSDFIYNKRDKLMFYFAIHGFGQKFIIPYGDRVLHQENFSEMENFAKQAILRMYKATGNKYAVGTTYDTMGLKISGTSASWVKKMFHPRYVFTIQLRDNGTFGLALPPEEILPACKEAVIGLKELMTVKHKFMKRDMFCDLGTKMEAGRIIFVLFILYFSCN